MMKSFAFVVLFTLLFQDVMEIQAKTIQECMQNACLKPFNDAAPCYLKKRKEGCEEAVAGYKNCMMECHLDRKASYY
ncbi:hypothetical protein M514_01915 [Trichuris suis]|uniref:Uncharacterized protein n=1 Tax=Trichuris suis TaxID=68888 RepID=A0A085MII4_9BILA|nr:hypothetical protein M513_01915 [Trichuris suis]KFD62276.1 hypothetical protein M514_01915 [Trichuris suis]